MWIFDSLFRSEFEGMTGKQKTLAVLQKYKKVPLYVFLQHWLGASYGKRIQELRKEYDIGIEDTTIRDLKGKIIVRKVVYFYNWKKWQISPNG